jgi:hypothetical protein
VTASSATGGVGDITILMDVETVRRILDETVDVAVDVNTASCRLQEDAASDASTRSRSEDAGSTSERGSYKEIKRFSIP